MTATTSTERCHARTWAEHLTLQGASTASLPTLGLLPGGNSTIWHNDYAVAYYDDNSVLIWARGEGFLVLDDDRTYYRDTVEHLARCLGLFSKERRAAMVQKSLAGADSVWIDGICWGADGSYLEM